VTHKILKVYSVLMKMMI